MKKNPAESFTDCLAKIYRSEDLKTSIRMLYSFFKDYLPLDYITMLIYDVEQSMLRYRIHSTEESVVLVEETKKVSEDTRKEALAFINSKIRTLYIPNGQKHSIVLEFDEHVGIREPASTIAHGIEVAQNQYAVLALVVWEEDRYNQKDIDLVKYISEPIDNALRHIYSQLVITPLRNRLTSDNREARKRMVLDAADSTTGLKDVMSRIEQVARLDTPVLLIGETGVGKELIANTIHQRSRRAEGPLVSINCGAIVETLLDSELFGHEKGAFTGAGSVKIGFFEQANGGTIFLDEVCELSMLAQVKLLRVLQNMIFQRVGGQKTISVDVRVITATNRDIARMVENKEFRKDLWFRLNTFPITIPPLRERKEDIPELAEYFAKRLTVEMNLPYRYRFASHAMEQLKRYNWPGNVRELENVIERALILGRGAPLSFPYLDTMIPEAASASSGENHNQALTMKEMMRLHIINVLNLTRGRIEGRGGAAEILDMKTSTLRSRMKKLGIRIVKFPDNIFTV
jgi:transcriptional regulator with GAF, ATPase, and Fis domain